MGAADPFRELLDDQVFLADEELVLDVDEMLSCLNHVKIGVVDTVLFVHEALAPGRAAPQKLLLISRYVSFSVPYLLCSFSLATSKYLVSSLVSVRKLMNFLGMFLMLSLITCILGMLSEPTFTTLSFKYF